MYIVEDDYYYEAGDGCFVGGELADGMEFEPECQCLSGYYDIPTYENIATGERYCSCEFGQILDCNCSGPDVANSCGTGYVNGCAGCGPISETGTDDCGLCPGDDGYNAVIVECLPESSGEGGTVGQQCDCYGNVCDCAGDCVTPGAGASQTTYYGDHEGDGCCDQSDFINLCSDVEPMSAYLTEIQCMSGCNDQWDTNPENDCPLNNFDECGTCDGEAFADECIGNDSCMPYMDCNGICGGTAYMDDCGICGGNNASQDECGICHPSDPIQNGYQMINVIGDLVNITYGSFGCNNRQWYNSSYDSSGGTCEVEHCGCQCAGCTNIFSPSYTDKAKYSVECTSEEKSLGICNSWFCNDGPNEITGEPNNCETDFCEDGYNGWDTANTSWEIRREYSLLYCDQIYGNGGTGPSNYFTCLNNFEWQGMCIVDDVIDPDSSCLGDVIPCSVGECASLIISNMSYDMFKCHGEPEHGSGYNFYYCSNDTIANPACPNYENPTVAQECVNEHGEYCCGILFDYEHCRTGVRSDLYWNVSRSQEDIPEYTYEDYLDDWYDNFEPGVIEEPVGDVDGDGIVNILDLVKIVQYIIGNDTFTPEQIYQSDINQDGIVNILDIITIVNNIVSREHNAGRSRFEKLRPTQESRLIQELMNLGLSFDRKVLLTGRPNTVISKSDSILLRKYIRAIERYRFTYQSTRSGNTRTNDYEVDKIKFIFNAPTCIPANVEIEIGEVFNTTANGIEDWGRQVILPETNDNFFILTMEQQNYAAGIDISGIADADHLLTIYHENVHFQVAPQFPITYSQQEGYNLITRNIDDLIAAGCTQDGATECWRIDACYDSGIQDGTDEFTCLYNFEQNGVLGSDMLKHYNPDLYCVGSNCVDNKFYWGYKERTCTLS